MRFSQHLDHIEVDLEFNTHYIKDTHMPRAKKETKITVTEEVIKKEEPVVKQTIGTSRKKKDAKAVANTKKQPIGTSRLKKEEPAIDPLAEFKEELKKELYNEIKQQVAAENLRQKHIEATKEKVEATVTKSELVLSGIETFRFTGNKDGLNITKNDLIVQSFNKGGAVGIGTSSPKAVGPGSVHIKSNYNSEASLPVDGKGQVRGLLIESDADDSNAFLFRGVSRKNRQGLNLTGSGELSLGLMHDETQSKLNVYQPVHNKNVFHGYAPSRYFNSNLIDIETQATSNKAYNFIEAKNQSMENGDKNAQKVFTVDGTGAIYSDGTVHSNNTGYAEMFEWGDGNPRKEDRTGYVVTLSPKGMLVIANEGDDIVGVVSKQPAIIGGAAWNYWNDKYYADDRGNRKEIGVHIMEWENRNHTVGSYFNSTLPADFKTPENTLVYETHPDGSDMYTGHETEEFNRQQEYKGRTERNEWAPVIMHGTATVCKGQVTGQSWIRLADLSDDLERWLIK